MSNVKIKVGKQKRKVLIIDDDQDICLFLSKFLKDRDYDVDCELELLKGLAFIQSKSPDIVIIDNNLPDGLGINQLSFIRNTLPQTLLIMMSAMVGLKEEALSLGADFFINKPFKLNIIAEILNA